MNKTEDENTRYYLDVDLDSERIIKWDYDHKGKLAEESLSDPNQHRIFLTKGQYHKLVRKYSTLQESIYYL